jgi:hypothetical protein
MPNAPFVTISEAGGRLQTYFPDKDAQRISVQLRASKTFPYGQVLCPVTATPGLYDAPGAAGVGPAECILEYPVITDTAGKITIGTVADPYGTKYDSVPAYITGNFLCADLTGLGADEVIVGQLGKVKMGDHTTGVLYMGGS